MKKLKTYQRLWVVSTLLEEAMKALAAEEHEVMLQAAYDYLQETLKVGHIIL